jgi:mitochondrial fission protein ELM1
MGLARAISPLAEARVVAVPKLPAALASLTGGLALRHVRPAEGALAPPWPDVLVSCGRRGALASQAIARTANRRVFTVHVQAPPFAERFDLVVALPHDRLSGPNVVQVQTALHAVRPAVLAAAAAAPDARLAGLPRPWIGVLVGGATRHAAFRPHDAERLAAGLDRLRAAAGGSLLITPSRRTPADLLAMLRARYGADPAAFLWDGEPPNPYLAILAGADELVVTADSISMASEALSTGAPVRLFEPRLGRRHRRFAAQLLSQGLATRLDDPRPATRRAALDPTFEVAEEVCARLGALRRRGD